MEDFKVGDRVRCVIDRKGANDGVKRLQAGCIYTVSSVGGNTLLLKDVDGFWGKDRFEPVAEQEWKNGDDVEFHDWKGKYVGVDPSHSDWHVIRPLNGDGTWGSLRVIADDEIRRPKPPHTLEELLERSGDGWIVVSDQKSKVNDDGWYLVLVKNVFSEMKRELSLWEPTRQACIDAAWELLVKESTDANSDK